MEYVYRALRANEFYNKMLMCKEYFEYAPLIGIPQFSEYLGNDALDLVGAHLTKGNTTITPWISCTKDYERVKHYMYDKNERVYGMAFIKNHSKDALDCPQFFTLLQKLYNNEIDYNQFIMSARRIELGYVKKLVLDFSYGDSELFKNLMGIGLVRFCDGRIRPYLTRWEHNYSYANEEVLALGEINKEDIYICNNLVFDLLNYLRDKNVFESFNDEILDNTTKDLDILYSLLAIEGITINELLRNAIKRAYDKMGPQLQEIFIELYIYNKKKSNYINEAGISSDYLNMVLDIMYKLIIKECEYLNDLINAQPMEVKKYFL